MKLSRLALAVALLPAANLYAADKAEPYELEPSVVTRATDLKSPVPASVQVITRAEIESSVSTSLLDVLRGKAGIQVHDTIGNGSRATFSLRGFGENSVNNTLLLVDGRSLNQPFMGGRTLTVFHYRTLSELRSFAALERSYMVIKLLVV